MLADGSPDVFCKEYERIRPRPKVVGKQRTVGAALSPAQKDERLRLLEVDNPLPQIFHDPLPRWDVGWVVHPRQRISTSYLGTINSSESLSEASTDSPLFRGWESEILIVPEPNKCLVLALHPPDREFHSATTRRRALVSEANRPARVKGPVGPLSRCSHRARHPTQADLTANATRAWGCDLLTPGRGPRDGLAAFFPRSARRTLPRYCACLAKKGLDCLIPQNLTKRYYKPALKRAGLDGFRLYDLRHTTATALLMRCVPVNAVSARLGHSSAKNTLDVYGHVLPEADELVGRALDSFFEGRTGSVRA